MSATTEQRVSPVDPVRLHQALDIYQAALVATDDGASAGASPSNAIEKDGSATQAAPAERPGNRGILAVKKQFPDAKEFKSLSLRLQRFAEVVGDKKLLKWGMVQYSKSGGFEIHDAVVHALAKAPFRKSGVLDKPAFHTLVKAEYTRLEAGEKE